MPEEVYVYEFESPYTGQGRGGGKGGKGTGKGVAPSLVGTKRKVERERVKDTLRGWLEGRSGREKKRREVAEEGEREEWERRSVRDLVRRFRAWAVDQDGERTGRQGNCRWGGADSTKVKEEPARAKVSGLRRFWEGVGRAGG